jgi:adenylate cyclase
MMANGVGYSIAYYIAVFITVLLIAVLMYGLTIFAWDSPVELRMLDVMLRLRPAPPPNAQIVVLAIDEKTTVELGALPWSRAVHARILNALRQAGAGLIVYDVLMDSPDSTHPGADSIFWRAMVSKKDVYLPMIYDPLRGDSWSVSDIRRLIYLERHVLTQRIMYPTGALIYHYYYFVPPWADFTSSAAGVGVNVLSSDSKIVREAQLAYLTRVEYPVPSSLLPRTMVVPKLIDQIVVVQGLPLIVARRWLAVSKEDTEVVIGRSIRFLSEYGAQRSIPIDEYGRMIINYSGPANTYQHFSAVDLLEGRVSRSMLANKIVIVGVTDPNASSMVSTPYGPMSPPEVTANSIGTILNGSFIVRRREDALLALLVTGVLLSMLLPFVPPRAMGPTSLAVPVTYLIIGLIVLAISGHVVPLIPGIVLCILAVVFTGFVQLAFLSSEVEDTVLED